MSIKGASIGRLTGRGGFFLSAFVVLLLIAAGLALLGNAQDSSAATTTLVPSSDRANDSTGWQDDGNNNDCGNSGTECSEEIDEDVDSPNDGSDDRIETESSSPSNDRVEFEISNVPGGTTTVTAINVRYRAALDNDSGADTGTVLIEVRSGGSTLGSPSAQSLTTSFNTYSYNITGLNLTEAQANGLYLRITGNSNTGNRINISVINLDITYSAVTPSPSPSPTPAPTPVPNPPLGQSCGVDMVIVIDNSASISSGELSQIQSAMTAFVNAFLPATPTQIAVVEFNSNASVIQGFSNNATTVNNAINGISTSGGYTNWDDALYDARNLFPNRPNPDLIVFGSDGNPTARFGHLGNSTVTDFNESASLAEAIDEADAAKLAGIRIQTVGIGNDLSVANLEAISSADAVITSDFAQLAQDLSDLALTLCGGTVNVTKIIDADGNLGTTGDQTPGENFTFDANVDAPDSSTPSSGDTDAGGQISFDIDLGGDNTATLAVVESPKPGYGFIGASCEAGGNSVGQPNGGAHAVQDITVTASDIVACTFYNVPLGQITVVKDVDPGTDPQDFVFNLYHYQPSFALLDQASLDDDGADANPLGHEITYDLLAGVDYGVSEAGVSGWDVAINCVSTDTNRVFPGTSFDPNNNGTGIALDNLGIGEHITCTFTNTKSSADFTVKKNFVPNSGASVDVTLSCVSGTASPAGSQSVSEGSPATWTVSGYSGDPDCTATESPIPDGYDSNGTCSGALIADGECTITNTLKTHKFYVGKNWIPDSAASVNVTLVCDTGTVVTVDGTASESDTAEFDVNGYTGDPNCVATENPIPAGYSSSGTCEHLLSIGSCVITNTLNTGEFTVTKDWVPDNPFGSVDVTLVCTDGTVQAPNPKTINGDSSAVFTVTGFVGTPSCTATESPNPPSGFTASNGGQCTAPINDGCTITNTLNSTTFRVYKDWQPDNGAGVVIVSLYCGPDAVVETGVTPIIGDSYADFTVVGYVGDPTCTATEIGGPPLGYTSPTGGLCSGALLAVGQCTIVNVLNSATFHVDKNFVPDSGASVNVSIDCGGNGTISPNSAQSVSEAAGADWTITGYTPPLTCSATESPVPAGYIYDQSDCVSVLVTDGPTGSNGCTIWNYLRSATVEVYKDFVPDVSDAVTVSLTCGSGSKDPNSTQQVTQAAPGVWTVTGFNAGATCTASESPVPSGYTADQSDCLTLDLVDGQTASCEIINTLNQSDFRVRKDFSDDNTMSVSVTVDCSDGTVTTGAQDISESGSPGPQSWHVEGYNGDPTCTATESPIPAGYISTGQCSALLSVGECTIVNTLREGDFQVLKDWDPDNPNTDVTTSIVCTTGTPSPASQSASEETPANFTVSGYSVGATCTATEDGTPVGYTKDESDCVDVGIESPGFCTIVNTLNSAEFTVYKDFTDNDPMTVKVSLSCGSGDVSPAGQQDVSEAAPFTWTVTGFTGNPDCTATETIPGGYVSTGTCAADLLQTGECTITNEPNSADFTVKKDFQPDSPNSRVFVTLTCDSGTPDPAGPVEVFEATPAVFTVYKYTGDPNCTGVENPIPTEWTSNGECSALLSVGECTIVNVEITPTPTIISSQTPEPTPTPTPSPTPTPTAPPPATPTPSPTPFQGTPAPPGPTTPAPTPTPSPTALPATETPEPPTPTPVTPTPTPTPEPTLTPSPTALPATQTPAPTPSPTALPAEFPPTGGGSAAADSAMMIWFLILGLGCVSLGAAFGTLALKRR